MSCLGHGFCWFVLFLIRGSDPNLVSCVFAQVRSAFRDLFFGLCKIRSDLILLRISFREFFRSLISDPNSYLVVVLIRSLSSDPNSYFIFFSPAIGPKGILLEVEGFCQLCCFTAQHG